MNRRVKKINMQVSEIADRWTICILKARLLPSSEEREYFAEQMESMEAGLPLYTLPGFFDLLQKLLQKNTEIWNTEDSIRTGAAEKSKMDLRRIGRLALRVRDLNRERCKIKNDICDLVGDGWKENKHNYGAPPK